MAQQATDEQIREAVRQRYSAAARRATQECGCCSGSQSDSAVGPYAAADLREVPAEAAAASMGCGNPTLLASLKPGEVVLDLGSGGGIDVILSAKRVGPEGKAYGLDMTDEMLEMARENAQRAGVANVEFLKGNIEAVPLPNASVDVVISNCVINLSPDKDAVLAEAHRVLRPGGRFAVADIVVQGGELSPEVKQALALWVGCISGALTEDEYHRKLAAAGFVNVGMEVLREYTADDIPAEMQCCIPQGLVLDPGTKIVSAFVTALKPGRK